MSLRGIAAPEVRGRRRHADLDRMPMSQAALGIASLPMKELEGRNISSFLNSREFYWMPLERIPIFWISFPERASAKPFSSEWTGLAFSAISAMKCRRVSGGSRDVTFCCPPGVGREFQRSCRARTPLEEWRKIPRRWLQRWPAAGISMRSTHDGEHSPRWLDG